jgi:protein-S-isoprenylcysteine O-methyltransferase Ste14
MTVAWTRRLAQGYRGFIQGKTRILLAWIFAALLVLSARELPRWHGIIVCLLGASLRYWASGYLRKDSHPAVGGPYAYVRNPLYLGTYLMALGTAMAVCAWPLFVTMTVLFAAIYHYIILDEELKLRRIFGAPYERYLARVPRFFPVPSARLPLPFRRAPEETLAEINPEPSSRRFSSELAARNKAYEAYLSFAGLIGFVSLVALAWRRFA